MGTKTGLREFIADCTLRSYFKTVIFTLRFHAFYQVSEQMLDFVLTAPGSFFLPGTKKRLLMSSNLDLFNLIYLSNLPESAIQDRF